VKGAADRVKPVPQKRHVPSYGGMLPDAASFRSMQVAIRAELGKLDTKVTKLTLLGFSCVVKIYHCCIMAVIWQGSGTGK
jgi:hypothetical protein